MSKDTETIPTAHLIALALIADGADVTSRALAGRLRELQQIAPDLLDVGNPMGTYEPLEKLPFFGAKTTDAGWEYLQEILQDEMPEPCGV